VALARESPLAPPFKAALPSNYTFASTDAGVHTFTVTLNSKGCQSITAKDTATTTITGTDSGIQVVAAVIEEFFQGGTIDGIRPSFMRRERHKKTSRSPIAEESEL
jgi:hypothetical protein